MSELINFLLKNRENKRVLACLRQGLVETTEFRAWPLLARYGGIGHDFKAHVIRTVAGLFAYHPNMIHIGNIGTTCRQLCDPEVEKPWEDMDANGKVLRPGPVSRKFGYLLAAERDEICDRVIRIVLYAKSKEIPVNYDALENDLVKWPRSREFWARAFWGGDRTEKSETDGGDAS